MNRTFYIASSGYKGAFLLLALALLSFVLDLHTLAFVCVLILVFWVFLFRNPERLATHLSDNAFLSPIDGEIESIQTEGIVTKIIIKVGILDVGVLRSPMNIDSYQMYCVFGSPLLFGTKRDFFSPKVTLTFGNHTMILIQNLFHIFPVFDQENLIRGERMGFLKAGKVELKLKDIELKVNVGDRLKGGESVIGYLQ